MQRDLLLSQARAAAQHAYAPFSRFRVGAALVVVDEHDEEHIVTGCNVENASYGLSLCAERNALSTAVAQFGVESGGKPQITQLAVACIDAPPDAGISLRSPCGACRQWIAELAPDAEILIDSYDASLSLEDLLPYAFRLEDSSHHE